ncbi:MAG: IPT/TIG domain-containing protein [Verrucomicrobia bacterium]|nr:IPT/TIG domain-containing protein [Verrucomicrobiota bacterium]
MKPRRLGRCLFTLWLLAGALAAHGQSITSFSPTYGQPGRQVDIYISGFTAGVAQVQFGSVNADFQVINAGYVRATVPTNGLTGVIYLVGPPPTYRQASSSSFFYVAPRIDTFYKYGSGGVVAAVNDVIQVEGANFQTTSEYPYTGTVVLFGSTRAANVSVTASSQLQVTVPAGATTGPLGVGTFAGTNFTMTNLVIGNGLVISSFAPTSGTTNDVVILEGGNFTGVTNVTFNGTNAPNFFVTAPNQLHVAVPPGATTGPIGVRKAGLSSTSSVNFVVTGIAPIITGFTPAGGKAGDPVRIDGQYFTGATNVTFNGTNVISFTVTADSQINTTVPPGVTAGPIRVESPYGFGVSTSNFLLSPIITGFDPVSGQVGRLVNIFGENFAGVTNVQFGGTSAVFTAVAQNQLTAEVPPGASNGPITVISPAGTNTTSSNFTVFAAAPVITGFDPAGGLADTPVTISGANFVGVTSVAFNGVSDPTFGVTSDSQILAHVPAAATTGPISVSGPGGTATTTNDFYLPPRLTSLTPTNGIVGGSVILDGTSFTGVSAVEFTAGGSLYVSAGFTLSATQIVAAVPTNALTGPLRLTAPAGLIITTNSFSVLPKIYSVTPLAGPAGTLVTISGNGFNTVTNVRFGGYNAVFTNTNTTEIIATVPASGAMTGAVSVRTTDGADTGADTFVVTVAADVSVKLTNSPVIGLQNHPFTYTVAVSNAGPSLATSVLLTNNLPTNAAFLSATAAAGTVTQTNQVVTWRIPILTNLTGAVLSVAVMPTNTASLLFQANVTAAESEPLPSDNSATLSTLVVSDAQRTISVRRLTNSTDIELRWPASSATFTLQQADALWLSDVLWLDMGGVLRVTNTNGVFHVLTNDTAGEQQYFRLKYP